MAKKTDAKKEAAATAKAEAKAEEAAIKEAADAIVASMLASARQHLEAAVTLIDAADEKLHAAGVPAKARGSAAEAKSWLLDLIAECGE